MKRILHFITGLELGGGAENMLLQILPDLERDFSNTVCVIKGHGAIGKKLEEKGIPVFYLDYRGWFDPLIIQRYKHVLTLTAPDIQINYLIHADILGRFLSKIFHLKNVSYIRNIHKGKKLLLLLDKLTLPLADFVLTNSETARSFYINKMRARPTLTRCIPNYIDLSRIAKIKFDNIEKRKELGISPSAYVIGTVARLEKQKDIPTLIRAYQRVHQQDPATHLIIVGTGTLKTEITELIKTHGIESTTTLLTERIPGDSALQIINAMDIFILPSLNEGMSNALLESMALKKLIITSDIEENKELIKDGISGLNFKTGNDYELAKTILKRINNPENQNLQQGAYKLVTNKYEKNQCIAQLRAFLLNIL